MNPYQKLPKSSFWRSGVVEDQKFLNIHTPKWGIDTSDCIVTMGSCFAQHVGKKLKSTGFNVPYFDSADGIKSKSYSANYGNIYTVRQALQLIQESNGKFRRDEKYWEVEEGYLDPLRPNVFLSPFKSKDELDRNRKLHLKSVRRAIEELDVLVFTLGLTEAWERVSCKSILPVIPGVLGGTFQDEDYVFHNFNYAEVSDDLNNLIDEILLMRKGKKFRLLLTVSPVPLTATAEPRHVLLSTVTSKSILRAVADEFVRNFELVDYFPSFEIVTNPRFLRENYEENLRNVKQSSVNKVMKIFHSSYVKDSVQSVSNISNMIDGVGDIDCEEALLEAFSDNKNNDRGLYEGNKEKILFFGNSHLAGVKIVMGMSSEANEFMFVPANFLKNNPFNELEEYNFSRFIFKNDSLFQNMRNVSADYLVVVGLGIFGDGIIRTLGPLTTYIDGMSRNDHSPNLPTSKADVKRLYPQIIRFVLDRLLNISRVVDVSVFKGIVWIPSPDLPERVAINRFGMEEVNSGIYSVLKDAYCEIFDHLFEPLKRSVKMVSYEKHLNTFSGFLDDKYAKVDNPYDTHPHWSFYSDQKISEKVFEILRLGFDQDKSSLKTENLLRLKAVEILNSYIKKDEKVFTAYTTKTNILLELHKIEEAKNTILRSIELGDDRNSAYRQASNISHRLKDTSDAVMFAKKAVDAKDNSDISRANHKEHLANMLRVNGELDEGKHELRKSNPLQ